MIESMYNIVESPLSVASKGVREGVHPTLDLKVQDEVMDSPAWQIADQVYGALEEELT